MATLRTAVVSKFGTFCPLVKNGGEEGGFCQFLWRSSRAPTYRMKTIGILPAILKLRWQKNKKLKSTQAKYV